MKHLPGLVLCAALASACADTTGEQVELEFSASGTEGSFVQGAWEVTLERAEVGFGPLYLCPASIPSDELCGTALVELRSAVTIDALDPNRQLLDPLRGTTGTVRSAVYDYGISWPLTFRAPRPSPGGLSGHSARFEGTASDGTRSFRFIADVDVAANAAGRLVAGDVTEHVVAPHSSLHLIFEPGRWWRHIDFEILAADIVAAPEPAEADATVRIEPGTVSYGSLIHEMTAGARPAFEWSHSGE